MPDTYHVCTYVPPRNTKQSTPQHRNTVTPQAQAQYPPISPDSSTRQNRQKKRKKKKTAMERHKTKLFNLSVPLLRRHPFFSVREKEKKKRCVYIPTGHGAGHRKTRTEIRWRRRGPRLIRGGGEQPKRNRTRHYRVRDGEKCRTYVPKRWLGKESGTTGVVSTIRSERNWQAYWQARRWRCDCRQPSSPDFGSVRPNPQAGKRIADTEGGRKGPEPTLFFLPTPPLKSRPACWASARTRGCSAWPEGRAGWTKLVGSLTEL